MSSIIDINSYKPASSDKYFFDANVLMYIYTTYNRNPNNLSKTKAYSKILNDILKAGAKIYISALVLSEFINRIARIEGKIQYGHISGYDFKKHFRPTDDYKNTIKQLTNIIKGQILKVFDKLNDDFELINTHDLFQNLELSDFNDEYFIHLCQLKGIKIVTDDKDFKLAQLKTDIITANRNLLGS